MKIDPSKSRGAKRVMLHAEKRCVEAWYVRVMAKNSTTLDTILKVRCETWQLVWYLGTQTEFANHLTKPVVEHALNSLHKVV